MKEGVSTTDAPSSVHDTTTNDVRSPSATALIVVDGLPLTNPRNVRYTCVDVSVDGEGIVRITTKGSCASAATAGEPRRPERDVSLPGRYWFAVQPTGSFPEGWLVTVSINDGYSETFRADESKILEVTSALRRGKNRVRIRFERPMDAPVVVNPKPMDKVQVFLAPGHAGIDADNIELSTPIFLVERQAAQAAGEPEVLEFVLPPPR